MDITLPTADQALLRVGGVWRTAPPSTTENSTSVLPGAFDPMHLGHRRMVSLATKILGRTVELELSIENVDKQALTKQIVARRASQIPPSYNLWLTRAATFVEKAQRFPETTFIVGADTILRIADTKYYGGIEQARDQAIEELAGFGATFLVFGRLATGDFRTLSQLNLPHPLHGLCEEVPEALFREDVSSSELRENDLRSRFGRESW